MLYKKYIPQINAIFATVLLLAVGCLCTVAYSEVPTFNYQKVPKTTQDLIAIQDALVENLARVRKATVSISLGEGFGSGVIVSADGLVLTAAHVTAAVGKELTVILNDGTRLQAISMGLVSNTDAAMMRITESGDYPYVEINKNNDYRLSHWVMALGHSGGFDEERGPVVRLGRILKDSETTFHTDCKVIGGDSGGPLFDLNGELIGIHSRVSKSMEQNMHVPMREYIKNWKSMKEDEFLGDGPFAKRPVKGTGFLGVSTMETDDGLLIKKVGKNSAAEKAGLKTGDVICKVNDREITLKTELKDELKQMAADQTITITILRNKQLEKVKVKLGNK